MIIIDNYLLEDSTFGSEYPRNSVERTTLNTLYLSGAKYQYDSIDQLKFELSLRKEIVNAANALYQSNLLFRVFRKSICNPEYWKRRIDGGFRLRDDVNPSDAINDIFYNGSLYGTECATAMIIVYYKALLSVFGKQVFNKMFPTIYLMNWHSIDRLLREVGIMRKERDYFPGDRRYFANPDVDPLVPQWQGENVIDMNWQVYYGHGIGKQNAETIVADLNSNRRINADEVAYLMNSAGRPNFKNLSDIYYKSVDVR